MSKTPGWYLYAVTTPETVGQCASLPEGAEIIAEGPLAAVASPFSGERVRPDRRTLAVHHGVHRSLLDAGVPFLPVSFGVVAPTREDLVGLLCTNRKDMVADLRRLSGKVEMGLKAVWDVPNIFEFFVFENRELARLRDDLLGRRGGGNREERIEVGRAFEAMQTEARERHEATVRRALASCAIEVQRNPPRDEKTIMDLVFLIERNRREAFEQAVLDAAAPFDDRYAFDYNGPWPPYHFVRATMEEPQWRGRAHREVTS